MTDQSASFADQIDELADTRGWGGGDDESIKAYLNGTTTLSDAVQEIVSPINALYTSADSGQAHRDAELTVANQRQHYTPEEAEERWGLPLPEDQLPPELPHDYESTESSLWGLWGSVLHMAKKTPWDDAATQERLVSVVGAIKEQPDPPAPAKMTKALKNNWIWTSGRLWSTLPLLGPSARESWNDSPGCGAGFLPAEVYAWTNVNAFVARLTGAGVADFWTYCIWAMREGLEDDPVSEVGRLGNRDGAGAITAAGWLDVFVPAAAVWVLVLGRALYDREEDRAPKSAQEGNPAAPGKLWKEGGGKPEFSRERWAFWKERFGDLRQGDKLVEATRDIAAQAYDKMEEIENEAR